MPVFLITGASQGIGAAIARELSREADAHVILVARNAENLAAVAASCEAAATVSVHVCDVTDAAAVSRLATTVTDEAGVPDLVVNNAGVFRPGGFLEATLDDFREQVDVNLTSAFIVSQAFAPGMIDRRSGMFVFLGSVASLKAYPGGVAYCAAKHGLLGLARVMREEMRSSGIRVTTLLPGATWTPSWDGAGFPEERLMPAEDIAALVGDAYRRSPRTVVEEILVRPQLGDL